MFYKGDASRKSNSCILTLPSVRARVSFDQSCSNLFPLLGTMLSDYLIFFGVIKILRTDARFKDAASQRNYLVLTKCSGVLEASKALEGRVVNLGVSLDSICEATRSPLRVQSLRKLLSLSLPAFTPSIPLPSSFSSFFFSLSLCYRFSYLYILYCSVDVLPNPLNAS